MLTRFILAVIVLFVIIYKPFLIVIAGVAYLTWLFLKHPNCFSLLPTHLTMPPGEEDIESEEDLSRGIKERPTTEEVYAREVESKMKPGYKDDPKWKEHDVKVKAHNEWIRTKSDADGTMEGDLEPSLEELTSEVV